MYKTLMSTVGENLPYSTCYSINVGGTGSVMNMHSALVKQAALFFPNYNRQQMEIYKQQINYKSY